MHFVLPPWVTPSDRGDLRLEIYFRLSLKSCFSAILETIEEYSLSAIVPLVAKQRMQHSVHTFWGVCIHFFFGVDCFRHDSVTVVYTYNYLFYFIIISWKKW